MANYAIRIEGIGAQVIDNLFFGHYGILPFYLKNFDWEANDGYGMPSFTQMISDAMSFDTIPEALAYWRQQSTKTPYRPDGEPNRPLTALSISVVEIDAIHDNLNLAGHA